MKPGPEERFWTKVDQHGPLPGPHTLGAGRGPCWIWTGYQKRGYGYLTIAGVATRAHRYSFELIVGPIVAGLEIDHLCQVRNCVNPAHLEPVPPIVNNHRGFGFAAVNRRKTHCDKGHEFTPQNTIALSRGRRGCRICQQGYMKTYRAKRRGAA